jgi:hypothetical protein
MDNENKTGRGPIRFEFYDIMVNILVTKASNQEDGVGDSVGMPLRKSSMVFQAMTTLLAGQ